MSNDLVPAYLQPVTNLLTEIDEKHRDGVRRLIAKAGPAQGLSEEVSTFRWRPPLLRINQPTSRGAEAYDDIRPGDLYTTTGFHTKPPYKVILLYTSVIHQEWQAGDLSGAPICSSPGVAPGHPRLSVSGDLCDNCERYPFRNGERTSCNKSHAMWFLDADNLDNVFQVQFSKTSYKHGSKLLRLARGSGAAWNRVFTLSTTRITGSSGSYYVFDVGAARETTPDERKVASEMYKIISDQRREMLLAMVKRHLESAALVADNTGESIAEEVTSVDGESAEF